VHNNIIDKNNIIRDVLSIYSRGGTILTSFLWGGAKYEEKKNVVCKNKKSLFFKIRGGGGGILPPPLNDVPDLK